MRQSEYSKFSVVRISVVMAGVVTLNVVAPIISLILKSLSGPNYGNVIKSKPML
jgi:hypothetical protein